jgi:hypothetical protein
MNAIGKLLLDFWADFRFPDIDGVSMTYKSLLLLVEVVVFGFKVLC